jgi:serine/threonine protein kinase
MYFFFCFFPLNKKRKVLKGLEHLHKKVKVIHRDIKPSNLLINS